MYAHERGAHAQCSGSRRQTVRDKGGGVQQARLRGIPLAPGATYSLQERQQERGDKMSKPAFTQER